MFRRATDGQVSYDLFARGAARLSARLAARLDDDDYGHQQHQADATEPKTTATRNCHWRWVERTAPLTGTRVGVLELERWLPAASAVPEPQEQDDEAAVAVNTHHHQQNHHRYVFHAAHSAVYRVPVLCFRAERADGAPLAPEQVRADLSPSLEMHGPPLAADAEQASGGDESAETPPPSSSSSWQFYLARGEHPAGPFPGAPAHVYYLHPCRTAERMALLMGENQQQVAAGIKEEEDDDDAEAASRYLAAWLSAVSPAVGLPRPPQPEEDDAAETIRRRRAE
jgi:hypothetical protein